MIAEMFIWGFFSACGWLTANWTVDQVITSGSEKQQQVCTAWKEEKQSDGSILRTRECESKE